MVVGQYHLVAFTLNSLGVRAGGRASRGSRPDERGDWRAAGSSSSAPAPGRSTTPTRRSATAGPSPWWPAGRAPPSPAPTSTRARPASPPRLVEAEGGRGPRAVVADVTDAAACAAMVDGAAAAWAGSTAWCSTWASGPGHGHAGHHAPSDWDAVFAVNVRSHFLLARPRCRCWPRAARSCSSRRSPASRRAAASRPTTRRRPRSPACAARSPRRGPARGPGQRRRPRAHRHAARPPRHRRPPLPGQGAGAARPPGHRVGGGRTGRLPPVSDAASYITGQLLAVDGGLTMG